MPASLKPGEQAPISRKARASSSNNRISSNRGQPLRPGSVPAPLPTARQVPGGAARLRLVDTLNRKETLVTTLKQNPKPQKNCGPPQVLHSSWGTTSAAAAAAACDPEVEAAFWKASRSAGCPPNPPPPPPLYPEPISFSEVQLLCERGSRSFFQARRRDEIHDARASAGAGHGVLTMQKLEFVCSLTDGPVSAFL